MRIHARVFATLLLFVWLASLSQAQTFTTLASLTGVGGAGPNGDLVQGPDGSFYGTTRIGGTNNQGTIFKLAPNGTLADLYNFGSSPTDGAQPYSGLTLGADGNFCGTTQAGGGGGGTVFRMTPFGTVTILYSFGSSLTDGATPWAQLIQASDGNLYGTTITGPNGAETVFKVTPSGGVATIYAFASTGDVAAPNGVVQGPDGNLYGTTFGGGGLWQWNGLEAHADRHTDDDLYLRRRIPVHRQQPFELGSGIRRRFLRIYPGTSSDSSMFRITSSGTLTTIYKSSSSMWFGEPYTPQFIQGRDGNFYGVTNFTILKATQAGALTTLYEFGPNDGEDAAGVLMQGADGNLYGATGGGGAHNAGTIFRFSLQNSVPAYTCTNATAPTITSIDSASAYGGYQYFASGSWLEIKGTNLADPNDPRIAAGGQWTSSDFNGVNAPTSLDGISVSINGKPAYVSYISPGQINVQAPEDTFAGSMAITVTNCHATSSAFTFFRQPLAPGLLAPSNYTGTNGTPYLVATFQSDGAYVLSSSLGASFGVNSRPAKPGDLILAYGIGFGDVTPSTLPGVIVQRSNTLNSPVAVSFGSTPASVSYQGLAGNYVGLYEFYITVPQGLTSGDYPVTFTQNGGKVPQTFYLTVGIAAPAPTVQSVALSSSSVTGGTSVTGTVTLSAAAPSGGAVVTLSSNSSSATVPASVTVPAGATSANFAVSTSSVTSSVSATITASYAGGSAQAALTVTAPSGGTLPQFSFLSGSGNSGSGPTSPSSDFLFIPGDQAMIGADNGGTLVCSAAFAGYNVSGTTITLTGLDLNNSTCTAPPHQSADRRNHICDGEDNLVPCGSQ